ncbi:MAG: hypothetical protein Q8T09_04085 [Candidatus Melainabacteria bacterium]|nr:hypothetical protein [Candidatus Melainabacteria bacterium]
MTPTTAKTNKQTKRQLYRQPYRQPPTMLAYVVVPLAVIAGLFFLGWLII